MSSRQDRLTIVGQNYKTKARMNQNSSQVELIMEIIPLYPSDWLHYGEEYRLQVMFSKWELSQLRFHPTEWITDEVKLKARESRVPFGILEMFYDDIEEFIGDSLCL